MIKVKSLKSKVKGLLPLVFCLLPLSEIMADAGVCAAFPLGELLLGL